MFCPRCGAEYRSGFTRCSDCEVDLVPSLETPKNFQAAGPALAWRGDDPVLFSRILGILRESDILTFVLSNHDQLAFQPTTPRPEYGIFVKSEDAQRAARIVSEVREAETAESEGQDDR